MIGARLIRALARLLRTRIVAGRRTLGLAAATVLALGLGVGATVALAGSPQTQTTTYTDTQTVPVPPASAFVGNGGGDGWSVALSDTQVFNVFHHQDSLQVACHNQSDASDCWPTDPETITDASGDEFTTSGQPGMYLDPNTGKLYVYATLSVDGQGTGGVVCVDVSNPTADPTFCGFTALTAPGEADDASFSAVSSPMLVSGKLYAFNYFPGATVGGGTSGTENTLLCFDLSTFAPCTGQPYTVATGLGANETMNTSFPSPSTAAIGGNLYLPTAGSSGSQLIACWNPSTGASCTGSWPIALNFGFAGQYGAPFPMLDASGNVTGICLPTSSAPCFDLTGASVTTPAGLPTALSENGGYSADWDGPGLAVGPRVYIPEWTYTVACFDWSTGASCDSTDGSCVGGGDISCTPCTPTSCPAICPTQSASTCTGGSFPLTMGDTYLVYTVNPDPQRPTCLWMNSDASDGEDSGQIQSFDAYTAGACGTGDIRVLASSFVVPEQACYPTSWDSLQVLQPAPSAYDTGSITFANADGVAIPGLPTLPLDATGTADLSNLSGLDFGNLGQLPQFVISLTKNGSEIDAGQVVVQLTWNASYDTSCQGLGATTPAPASTTSTTTVTVTTPGTTSTVTNTNTNTNTVTVTTTTATTTTTTTPGPTIVKVERKHGPSCAAPSGRVGGTTVGYFRLGMTQSTARKRLARYHVTENRFDNFCLLHGWGIRLGYPTMTLLRAMTRSERAHYIHHVVLALTANRFYSLDGVRPGASLKSAEAKLHLGAPFAIGTNDWYFVTGGSASGVLKVRSGRVAEVGLAARALTRTNAQRLAFITSFDAF